MFPLNKKSRKSIETITGLSFDKIPEMDIELLDNKIETKIGHKLDFDEITDPRLIGRGSVYIFLNRLLRLNTIDKILSRI